MFVFLSGQVLSDLLSVRQGNLGQQPCWPEMTNGHKSTNPTQCNAKSSRFDRPYWLLYVGYSLTRGTTGKLQFQRFRGYLNHIYTPYIRKYMIKYVKYAHFEAALCGWTPETPDFQTNLLSFVICLQSSGLSVGYRSRRPLFESLREMFSLQLFLLYLILITYNLCI